MTTYATGQQNRAALLDSQRRVLERIANGAPLGDVLETMVKLIEEQAHGMRCAVLLADARQQRLSFAAAPSIPEDYKAGIDPFLRIAPEMGSCGTAAFLREPVYTQDTETDPLWKDCRDVAVRNGLRAIWSTPILSDDNAVLGTFAMYYGEPRLPSPEHIQLIDMATQMARVAIEAKGNEEKIQALSRQKEDHLRLVIDTIPTMAWSVRPDGVVDFLNKRWVDYSGLTLERYVQDPTGPIHREDIPRVLKKWRAAMVAGESSEDEMRLRRADGEYRWFLVRTVPLRDERENIVKWYGTSTDIEDRKRAEMALQKNEQLLSETQVLGRTGSWEHNLVTGEIANTEGNLRLFFGDDHGKGARFEDFAKVVHQDDREYVMARHAQLLAEGGPRDIEYRVVWPDGTVHVLFGRATVVRDAAGRPLRVYGTNVDITERKQAENALRDSGVQLQALSRRLVELQESERKELARELHDRVGQSLTALKINIDILQAVLASRGNAEGLARVADSAALLESTMDTIENVMSELRPPMLDDHGLAAALDWHARNFSRRTGIAVAVRGSEPVVRPALQVEIALFRIAQEALNNIAKHARAQRVEIALDHANGECVMSVQDDGVGFDGVEDASDKPKPGLGMVTMRERAQAVGGHFEVRALSGRGTRLTVRVPR
jgi:two-component system sensor histidine kinase UhpB